MFYLALRPFDFDTPGVADSRGWSDLDRTLLLQCVFTGKAQEAYSALTVDESKVYTTVRKAVLTAYELVPEAYRQRFRTWQRGGKQTHVEFARELGIHFNRWCASLKISTFVDLCNLVVLEQFKNSVPSHIAVYIREHNVKTAAEAAKLADEYVLLHRGGRGYQTGNDFGYRSGSQSFVGGHAKEEGVGPDLNSRSERVSGGHVYLDPTDVCHYCKARGHWKRECPKRGAQVKSAAFAASEKHAGFVSSKQVGVGRKYTLDQGDFSPFISDGHVSIVGSDATVPVKILRDTGAFNSYIVSSVLPFSEETNTEDHVLMQGMGLLVEQVPLHKLTLTCGLVQGEVIMGVRPALPLEGVDVILGNDLAGRRVWTDCLLPAPIVTSSPVLGKLDESAQCFPGVFTACAVTRAMCRAESASVPDQDGGGIEESDFFSLYVPDSLLSVSHSDLMAEQRADSSLRHLFDQVVTEEESVARGSTIGSSF
ncbi:uncharacterized protein LOC122847010 [Gambusia affinis]|uniref:uncharacterized protein LOC122847010 n=1 Tax=Gambusia affinis TaxID=33528 RepID=UPI001CDCF07C|nr:uncharacterized protein LOC122847010 [Gambusia affinis]